MAAGRETRHAALPLPKPGECALCGSEIWRGGAATAGGVKSMRWGVEVTLLAEPWTLVSVLCCSK